MKPSTPSTIEELEKSITRTAKIYGIALGILVMALVLDISIIVFETCKLIYK
jgi:hypothetical protein